MSEAVTDNCYKFINTGENTEVFQVVKSINNLNLAKP